MSRKNKQRLVLAVCAYAILTISQMILGTPWWRALIFSSGISGLIGFSFLMALGMGVRKANALIAQAIDLSIKGECAKARQLILAAVKLDEEWMNNRDVHSLYEYLVSPDKREETIAEAKRMKIAAAGWSKTPLQQFYASEGYYVMLVIFLALIAGAKIAALLP